MDEQEVLLQQQESQNINSQESGSSTSTLTSNNKTGIPDELKTYVEAASGVSLAEVCVHYDSPKPAEMHLTIYSEGLDIYVASGAEGELGKELWKMVDYLREQEAIKKATESLLTPPSVETSSEDSFTDKKEEEKAPEKETLPPTTDTLKTSSEDSFTDKKEEEKAPEKEEKKKPSEPAVDPHKTTVEEEKYASAAIHNKQVEQAGKDFEKAVKAAKTEAELRKLVTKTGEDLWKKATTTVQASKGEKQGGDNWNDADIYRARLRMRVALRKSSNSLLKGDKNTLLPELIHNLEQTSRGMTTANFPDKAEKKILISGFDPFQGMQTNPSGLVAMYFDGKTIGNANIQAAVFPVRFEDFDQKIVENFFGPKMSEVDAILTVSYTHLSPNIDIDRFSANHRRGDAPDNNDAYATEGPIIQGGENFYESTLPHEEIMELNQGRKSNDRKYYYPQQTVTENNGNRTYNSAENNTKQLSPQQEGPTLEELRKQGEPISGSGGSYLSNEIHYRVSKLRTETGENKDIPQGHLHIQEPNQHATFMKDMESLIQKVVTEINKP